MAVWHLIVRKPYDEVSEEFWGHLKESCERLLVCQHTPDVEEPNVHCHAMLVEYKKTTQALDKQRKVAGLQGEHSRLLKVRLKTREPYEEAKLGIYCIKGSVENVKNGTSYDTIRLETWAGLWVQPRTETSVATMDDADKQPTHYQIIEQVWQELQGLSVWEEVIGFNDGGLQKQLKKCHYGTVLDLLQIRLNEHKVRTSRNELERFFVTLLRQDYGGRNELRDSILKSVLR